MKLSLVVSQGVHAGKAIPVTVPDFVIGRDPQCQLRPASPAISKQHCGIAQRDGKVFVRDCGSTNGTFVNDEQVGGEREVRDGDKLRVGPLEFQVRIEATTAKPAAPKKAPSTNETALNEVTVLDAKKLAASPAAEEKPAPVVAAVDDDPDAMAALMLGMDDAPAGGGTPTVGNFNPDSTTVMEMPALGANPAEEPVKKEEKKKVVMDSSNAAAELLSKYMRRPRT